MKNDKYFFEKVNMFHPDKIADRIAGAIVDEAYSKNYNPKVAVEVLIGHDKCYIINETDTHIELDTVKSIVKRINNIDYFEYIEVPQDILLAANQYSLRCGDNGIFKGVPVNDTEKKLTKIAMDLSDKYGSDGKYIMSEKDDLIICQSNAKTLDILNTYKNAIVNPIGEWTGGTNVDTGATNRKLGSDMGRAVTGGGLHGKSLCKADVSVNIYAHLMANKKGEVVQYKCAIGDDNIDGIPYSEIVEIARNYINNIGGFEKFAEWGLIR